MRSLTRRFPTLISASSIILGIILGAASAPARADDDEAPRPPRGIERWLRGDPDDAVVEPKGPGLILMGGGRDVDEAFRWWKKLIAGGDVVVLRASGEDGYNRYLHERIGGCDSVETIRVARREHADDAWVADRIERAEGIFIAGGDQSDYVRLWKGTKLAAAIDAAWKRGAVIGGTSAGLAILGQLSFAAHEGTIRSRQALEDAHAERITIERDLFHLPALERAITDSHFKDRDRMGRLVVFLARIWAEGWADDPLGIGVDERTALVVGPDGAGEVVGEGRVYIVRLTQRPRALTPDRQVDRVRARVTTLGRGEKVKLPAGESSRPSHEVRIELGRLVGGDPYRR